MYICTMYNLERETLLNDWTSYFGVLILVLWVTAKLAQKDRFLGIVNFFTSEKYTQERTRESKWMGSTELILMVSGFLCLIFSITKIIHSILEITWSQEYVFVFVSLVLLLFFLLKNLTQYLVFFLFNIQKLFSWYWFYRSIGFIWMGNLLFINYLIFASTINTLLVSYLIVAGVLGVYYIWLSIKIYSKYQKVIQGHFLYFILYLCTLEIAPYVFAYKYITSISVEF